MTGGWSQDHENFEGHAAQTSHRIHMPVAIEFVCMLWECQHIYALYLSYSKS